MVVQRGAEAVFTEDGQKQIHEAIAYYKENAKIIAQALDELLRALSISKILRGRLSSATNTS